MVGHIKFGRALVALALLFDGSAQGLAQPAGDSITIVAGTFGRLGSSRKLDIRLQLQDLCAGTSERCDVYCSETSFGRYALGRKPICRVAYRCPDGSLRSVEAAREEQILIRCPVARPAERPADELAPLPYEPPGR